jgi:flagella basal body P-ring formation protein FlgA
MSPHLRAAGTVVGLAATAIVAYWHYHHGNPVHAVGGAFTVLVANVQIQKGTPGDIVRSRAGLYRTVAVRPSEIMDGAITDPATLAGKVAVKGISAGQQLTSDDFGPSAP